MILRPPVWWHDGSFKDYSWFVIAAVLLISTPLFHGGFEPSLEKTKNEKNHCFYHLDFYLESLHLLFSCGTKMSACRSRQSKTYNCKQGAPYILTYVCTHVASAQIEIGKSAARQNGSLCSPLPVYSPLLDVTTHDFYHRPLVLPSGGLRIDRSTQGVSFVSSLCRSTCLWGSFVLVLASVDFSFLN